MNQGFFLTRRIDEASGLFRLKEGFWPGLSERETEGTFGEIPADLVRQSPASLSKACVGLLCERLAKYSERRIPGRFNMVASAESCTGGLLAAHITENAGASSYFFASVVSYHDAAKCGVLEVSPWTIREFGAVSRAAVCEMLEGLFRLFPVRWAAAISGIAGPGGGSPEKPVGTVHVACAQFQGRGTAREFRFEGSRSDVRLHSVAAASLGLLELVENDRSGKGLDDCDMLW